jgi:transposase
VAEQAPVAALIASPYTPKTRDRTERGLAWGGDKVHLTETCEDGQPHLMTGVMTTPATTPDGVMGPRIQHDLAARDLLPGGHLRDGGDVDAELPVTVQTVHQIDVVGPPLAPLATNVRRGRGMTSGHS